MDSNLQAYDTPPPNYSKQSHATNGFSVNPSFAQIASYIVILFSVIVYYVATFSIFPNPVLVSIVSILLAVLIISSGLATCTNPTDRVVYYYKWSRHDKKVTFVPEYTKVLFCQFCDSYCLNTSKHCRSCNRCVNQFDHHCIWFNNCVGQRNYKYFFISILSTFAYAISVITHASIASFKVNYSDSSQITKIIFSWIVSLLLLVFAFLLLNLILLHIYLGCTGQTTYQFLQRRKRQEQLQRQQQKRMRQSNRVQPVETITANIKNQSQQSYANTKVIVVNQHFQESRRKIPAQKNTPQIQKYQQVHSGSEKSQSNKSKGLVQIQVQSRENINENQLTVNNDKVSQQSDRLPYIFRKNKSLKLLIRDHQCDSPRKRVTTQINLDQPR